MVVLEGQVSWAILMIILKTRSLGASGPQLLACRPKGPRAGFGPFGMMIASYKNDDVRLDFHPDDDVDNGCITKRIYCKRPVQYDSNRIQCNTMKLKPFILLFLGGGFCPKQS